MWNSLAFWGGASALLPLYLFDTSVTVALISLTVALALNSGIYSGFFTNHLDLSPNFAGTLIGITNSIGSLASILGPLLVGFIVTDVVRNKADCPRGNPLQLALCFRVTKTNGALCFCAQRPYSSLETCFTSCLELPKFNHGTTVQQIVHTRNETTADRYQ